MLERLWGPLVAAAHRPTGWDLEVGIPRGWEVEETAGSTLGSLEVENSQNMLEGKKECLLLSLLHPSRIVWVPAGLHGQRKVES